MEASEIRWEAPEFEERPKSSSWYSKTIIAALVLLGVAIWQENFLFGVFIVIAEILLLVWGTRKPPLIAFRLARTHLWIGAKDYPIVELERFSVGVEDAGLHAVTLHFRRHFRPTIRFFVPSKNIVSVETQLMALVPRIEHEESLLDALEKFFGF